MGIAWRVVDEGKKVQIIGQVLSLEWKLLCECKKAFSSRQQELMGARGFSLSPRPFRSFELYSMLTTFLEFSAATPSAFVDGDGIQKLRLVRLLKRWVFDLIKVADAVVDEFLIAIRLCLVGPRSLFPGFGSVFTVGHVEVLASPRRQCRDFHINYIAVRKCSSTLTEVG